MTTEDNIKAVLNAYFVGFKEGLIENAAQRIMEIKSECPYYDGYHKTCRRSLSPEEWHLVRERLPKTKGNYLVTVAIRNKVTDKDCYVYTAIDHYNGEGKWTDNNEKKRRVVAWKALDEPCEGV